VRNLLTRCESVSVSRRTIVYGVRENERKKVVLINMNKFLHFSDVCRFKQVPAMQSYSVGHVFRKQTLGHHKFSPLTSCDARVHTATSSTTFAVTAKNPNKVVIKNNSMEEKRFRVLGLESLVPKE
jgi:hypothetical protein